ncbi:MAG: hypothetical protein HFH82_07665 [Lachnospiraceae bacterium]|nr:hypothetical protein [Lachnospiraceae bacterium]
MKHRIKSYLVFTSFIYRICMFLAVPVIVTGIALWSVGRFGNAAMIFAAVLLPMVEIISDTWLFGGIQTKDMEKLDYLKTSHRGMEIMRNALSMDMARKLLTAIVVMAVCAVIVYWENKGIGREIWLVLSYAVSISWFCSILGTFITRYGSLLWFHMMVGYGMSMFGSICWFLPGLPGLMAVYTVILFIGGILVSNVAVRVAMKKVEGSYYDK